MHRILLIEYNARTLRKDLNTEDSGPILLDYLENEFRNRPVHVRSMRDYSSLEGALTSPLLNPEEPA